MSPTDTKPAAATPQHAQEEDCGCGHDHSHDHDHDHHHGHGHDHAHAPLTPIVRSAPKIGRNDPCPCGSGKKYKKCCLAA